MKLPQPSPRAQKRGVAIIVVLAVLTLMSALVLSLFDMTRTEAISSKAEADMLHTQLLADTTVNLVIGQLREATSQRQGDSPAPWASQPGAVTVHRKDGAVQTIFKLYSANELTASNVAGLSADLPANWNRLPDQFVDLNAPSLPDLKFPIVDPRAAAVNTAESAEGFSYDAATGVVLPQGDADAQRLPMPVRWIYQLRDGTLGTLDQAGNFNGPATADNPIVGRIAYWTDDESCKINVNTASEGVYWDSPRVTSQEDRDLANFQPSRGEYQHYPGHPAQVSLSSVLFPHQRLQAPGTSSETSADSKASPAPQPLPISIAQGLWEIAPGISADPTLTTNGGRQKAARIDDPNYIPPNSIATPLNYHLYTDAAEILYNEKRELQPVFKKHPSAVTRLERGAFFLTASSVAPETTLFGTPRICLWPINGQVNSTSTHAPPVERSTAFDNYMAMVSRAGARKYYVQRRDATNGSTDFYKCNGGENKILLDYLTKLTDRAFPGFSSADDKESFATKYGSGPTSDREQIFVSMFDYIRQTNLNDASLPWTNQFSIVCPGQPSNGYGQVSPLSTIGGPNYQASTTLTEAQKYSARGMGRMLTVSEVAFVFSCRAQVGSDGKIKGSPSSANRSKLTTPGDREIEVGVLAEGFVPAQGWTEYRPYCSIALGGSDAKGAAELSSVIPTMNLAGQRLELPGTQAGRSANSGEGPPKRWLAQGGSTGGRCFTSNIITFKPIVIPAAETALSFTGTAEQASTLKLCLYDDPNSAAASGTSGNADLIQAIPLALPGFSNLPLPELPTSGGKYTLAERFASAVEGASIINQSDLVQSLVPAHGDFRLLASARQSAVTTATGSVNRGRPSFVPHPHWGQQRFAHSLREPVSEPDAEAASGYFPEPQTVTRSPDFAIAPFAKSDSLMPQGTGFVISSAETIFQSNRTDNGARGPCFPNITGDFDNGLARAPDGAYSNRPDEGDVTGYAVGNAYFDAVSTDPRTIPRPSKAAFSPNRLLTSSIAFGSLPTGVRAGVPWQTLLFRPWEQADPKKWNSALDHYGFKTPRDHLLLDLFWMPVIEPYGISLPLATAGKINLNQTIAPFSYIHRNTALHALLKSEKILAIPNTASGIYKHPSAYTSERWRHSVDPAETLKLWAADRGSNPRPFLSASEICEHYLVPEGQPGDHTKMTDYWKAHQLTGDNSKERPYANLLGRLTTRSNVFRIHFKVQTLTKARSSQPTTFDPQRDKITAEFCGNALVERALDPDQPGLPDYAGEIAAGNIPKPLDDFYHWRIIRFQRNHN